MTDNAWKFSPFHSRYFYKNYSIFQLFHQHLARPVCKLNFSRSSLTARHRHSASHHGHELPPENPRATHGPNRHCHLPAGGHWRPVTGDFMMRWCFFPLDRIITHWWSLMTNDHQDYHMFLLSKCTKSLISLVTFTFHWCAHPSRCTVFKDVPNATLWNSFLQRGWYQERGVLMQFSTSNIFGKPFHRSICMASPSALSALLGKMHKLLAQLHEEGRFKFRDLRCGKLATGRLDSPYFLKYKRTCNRLSVSLYNIFEVVRTTFPGYIQISQKKQRRTTNILEKGLFHTSKCSSVFLHKIQ